MSLTEKSPEFNIDDILKDLNKIKTNNKELQINIITEKLIYYTNILKEKYIYQNNLENIYEIIQAISALNFKKNFTPNIDDTIIQKITTGLNILAKELEIAVISKNELEWRDMIFESILENIPIALYLKDTQNNSQIILWSKGAETIFELPREEVLGKSSFEILPHENDKNYCFTDQKVISEEKTIEIQEEINLSKKNKKLILRTRKIPLKIKHEKNQNFILGISEDITKKILVEKELEETIKAIESSSIVAITDSRGKIISINENFCIISGYEKEELLGQDHRIINSGYHSKEFFLSMWKTISSGNIWSGEIQNKNKNGNFYWVQTVITPIKDYDGKIQKYLSIRFDITKQKETQIKLFQNSKMAALGEMAAGISHEINNPLAIIFSKSELIKAKLKMKNIDDPNLIQDLNQIQSTVNRIVKILKGLQSFSRNSEFDEMEISTILKIIEDTISFCNEKFQNKNIELRLNCLVDYKIKCRPSEISQIILNLLNNSIDAISELSEKWVEIDVSKNENFLNVSIKDSGCGIPDEIVSRIMQPFFTTKELGKGTGLGLSISKGLALSNNGDLTYKKTNKNTCFVLSIPIYND
ncbi:PAS domain S-box protein [Silvanigrella aquatica]|uniref:histidine kinase n=1 Tax=Silvanigrella aquatica TaxID=1915309 RepID=A0A1L4CWU1_9BACT|nr:PAS domain S-box protein [Silvanigrella aquatica]APJ02420.1 hypothetical protein AXG55_00090 [Silvanigrella aquatica]